MGVIAIYRQLTLNP